MNTILLADELSIGIKNKINIVSSISFELVKHEFLAIIGPNGCGKTSFIKSLIGQMDILSGKIEFLASDYSNYDHKKRARFIAMMGQHSAVDPRMRVKEYIALGRFPHYHFCTRSHDNYCIEKVISELALEPFCDRKVGELSGGEFQRINLARALVQEPQLLLLDEPTNHLDPIAKIALLKHISEQNITTIAVLHDLNMVEYFADKVLILDKGKMSICSDVDEALNPYWMNKTFGLDTLEFVHPISQRTIRMFDIPTKMG